MYCIAGVSYTDCKTGRSKLCRTGIKDSILTHVIGSRMTRNAELPLTSIKASRAGLSFPYFQLLTLIFTPCDRCAVVPSQRRLIGRPHRTNAPCLDLLYQKCLPKPEH